MESEKERDESECTHYWLLDRPRGPTSMGVCKLCGEQAEFKNSVQSTGWDRVGHSRRRAPQART